MLPGATGGNVYGFLVGGARSRPHFRDFGVVIYDLETIHDAERGTYADKGLHECEQEEQIVWKRRSQIIEFAAVDIRSGARLHVSCRPEFDWAEVRSPAARRFAEDHGHDRIVQDTSLPHFKDRWAEEVMPFLQSAAGRCGRLAMIAHNGDKFDHFVLDKELCRLGMNPAEKLFLHRFDPVRTLKQCFGQDYGCGGKLKLEALHGKHVPAAKRVEVLGAQHQALNDCLMLREVLSHWQQLGALLATEIARAFCSTMEEVYVAASALGAVFASPIKQPPDAEALGGGAAGVGRGMRISAAEFVPGVPWTPPVYAAGFSPTLNPELAAAGPAAPPPVARRAALGPTPGSLARVERQEAAVQYQ